MVLLCTIFKYGIHDTQFLRSGIHNAQYLWLLSTIHNIYVWHPWYTIFLVSTMDNICNWNPWCTIFMPGIYDTQYLCLISMIHNIHALITSPVLFILYHILSNLSLSSWLFKKRQHFSSGHGHAPKSVTTTRLCPNPGHNWTLCQIRRNRSETVTPMW